ncbi:MAG TPA: Ku protein [Candidatus Polarisedimenticolaceae bacterium]|nr:Ku protein [Candidatus Polarisedimenticolaceae bacterium]
MAAPRALATATVSFGMVSIPVKLYSAAESSAGISFNLLHKDCGSRLKQQYICQKDGQVVAREQMVKGFEFSRDQYVVFTPEEMKELEEKASQTIEIAEFVSASLIDPIYFDKPYYVGPDKGGDRAYRLLAKAMRDSGRAALARYGARGKRYLVMLRPTADDRLVMQQLHYVDEVRPTSEIPIGEVEVREQELKLAMQLIEQISSDVFRPESYEDDVRKRIQEAIQRKVDGSEVAIAPVEAQGAMVIDLMEALKASLGKKAAASEAQDRKPPKRAAREEQPAPAERRPKAAGRASKA